MPRIIRRILFVFFVLVFFVTAGALLFSASGYRYHTAKGVVEKTGTLTVETKPRGARVLLNGSAANTATTPLTLSSILSGEYQLTVERDGFFPFSRRITITPGVSTLVNDVVLVRQNVPRFVAALSDPRNGSMHGDTLVIVAAHDIASYDMRTEQMKPLFHSQSTISHAGISASGALMVVETTSGWSIRDMKEELLSQKQSGKKLSHFQFAKGSDDIYARADDGIYRFVKDQRRFARVLAYPAIASYAVVDDALFTTREGEGLTEFRLSDGQKVRRVDDLPFLENILQSQNDVIVVRGAGQSLYLLDRTAAPPAFQQVTNASGLAFVSQDRFFSYNEFEVWEHNLTADRYTRNLVTRQSNSLQGLVPFTTRPFVVVISRNGSVVLRFLEQDATSEVSLATFDSVVSAFLDEREKTLVILGSLAGVTGLYVLPLIEEDPVFPLVK